MKLWTMIAIGCVLATLAAGGWSWKVLHDRRQTLKDTSARLDMLHTQVVEYQALSSAQQDTLLGDKPQQDIESRITSTIRSARISPIPRYSVSVQGDRVVSDSRSGSSLNLREQEISIRIPGLSVVQIGAFLLDWRANQQIWIPTSIEMIHDQRATDDRYTLQLNCTAIYHSEGTS